jgi:hypothetical protein
MKRFVGCRVSGNLNPALPYLSRLRPSDRESVPLRPLATDYSLLATYYSCFWEGQTLRSIKMRAAAFLVRGSENKRSRF